MEQRPAKIEMLTKITSQALGEASRKSVAGVARFLGSQDLLQNIGLESISVVLTKRACDEFCRNVSW